jgi:hypothetical protein
MATNMSPALTPFDPASMTADPAVEVDILAPAEDDLTIEVLPDGSVEVILDPAADADLEGSSRHDANLAEYMDAGTLGTLASDLLELVDADIQSRKDWADMYVKGLEVLGMKYEERTEPWDGACGVYSPLLTEAAIRFQSEMITETFPAQGPVKTQIIGEITRQNEEAAERVRADMNYRMTDQMVEYRPEHERLLYSLGLAGSAFKKVYYDPSMGRETAPFVPAEDIIMPYGASNVYNAERVTHVMRKTKNEVTKLQVAGFYRDVELGEPRSFPTDIEKKKAEEAGYTLTDDNRYQILEIHADYDLPGFESDDGVAYPYVITVERGTQTILAIRRNWDETDERKRKLQHFVQYTYVPGHGAYGLGFIHIIGGYARAGTSIIRQLVDAGTLANLPGGMKTKGLRVKGDDTPIAPGEFRDVDIASGALRDNIMPLPYKEPSQVLAVLLERITDDGRRLAAIGDLKLSDMSAQAPVGTTMALLERQLKTMSAVQARVHDSLKMEFKLLKKVIRDYMPQDYDYIPTGASRAAKQADYDLVEIIPVSDPNAATMAQRIMQYQAALQLAQGAPQIYDLPHLHRQMLEVLGIKNAEKLVPVDEDQKPRDPVSENMSFLTGKPTKAFIYQDHQAHIAAHMSLLQDPMIMQMIGQSPMGQQMGAAVMAHVAEHVAFSYRQQIEEQLGVPMTAPDAELDESTEIQLSRLVAQAAQQLLQSNTQKAQQMQAQQAAQNPQLQMAQAELQLKAEELRRKEADSQRDFQIAQEKLRLERDRIEADKQREQMRLTSQQRQNDTRLRADLVKHVTKPRGAPKPPKQ